MGRTVDDQRYAELADVVSAHLDGPGPHVVGISGAVAAGKTTIAEHLADAVRAKDRRVDIVATDAFLLPNKVLRERDLEMQKGFPASFDLGLVAATIDKIKAGAQSVQIPVYSHAIYDIVPDEVTSIESPDLVILEGIIALQAPVVGMLDAAVYIDADEEMIESWFVERFLRLVEEARTNAGSFYRSFVEMNPQQVQMLAQGVWDGINVVNLREHILPSKRNATVIVHKADDHSIRAIEEA